MRKPLRLVALAVVLGGSAMTFAWAQHPATPAVPAQPPFGEAPEDTAPTPPAALAPPAATPAPPDQEWSGPRPLLPRGGDPMRPRRHDRTRLTQMKALHTAVEKLRTAKEGPEKEAATKEVMQQLEKSFTHDLERREQEVSDIESRVKKLREQIDKRRKAKDDIISLRLKTIINETQGLGFPGPAGPVGFEHGEMPPGQMGGMGWAFPQGIPHYRVTQPAEQPEP